jgi:hypothetical protein
MGDCRGAVWALGIVMELSSAWLADSYWNSPDCSELDFLWGGGVARKPQGINSSNPNLFGSEKPFAMKQHLGLVMLIHVLGTHSATDVPGAESLHSSQ